MDAHAESTRSESTPAGPNEFTYFYLWDQVGSVRVVANGQGVTVETHDYEPYGLEMSSAMCPSSSLMRYAGQERDYVTSDCSDTVDYMHYRFYTSSMGRFMRPDNVNGNPMNPQSWNLYSYVHGNPVNLNDPTGHMTSASGQLGILGEGRVDPFNATDIDWSFVENPDQFQTRSTAKNMAATSLPAQEGDSGSAGQPGAPITAFGQDYSFAFNPSPPLAPPESSSFHTIPPPFGMDAIGDFLKGKGYVDFNLMACFGLGATAGFQFNIHGLHLYAGPAGGFGVSGSLTYSPATLATGWGHGFQGTAFISFQVGSSGTPKTSFFEFGGGFPAGVNWSIYYVDPRTIHPTQVAADALTAYGRALEAAPHMWLLKY